MSPRDRILEPYTRRVDDIPHKLRKTLAIAAALFLSVIIGFLVAALPVDLVVIPALPLVALLLIMLWMAPDIDPGLDRPLRTLFLLYMGFALVWPHYIAFVLPGVGFVTPPRLVLIGLVAVFVYFFATSRRLREMIAAGLDASPVAKWAFIGFVVLQFGMTIATNTMESRWFNGQLIWYLMFIIAVAALSFEGVLRPIVWLVVAGVVVVCSTTYWEYVLEYKIWMDWIPPFLRGDPELWDKVYRFGARAGTDRPRGSGTLLTPVTVGEFIAITAPFIVFLVSDSAARWRRWLGIPLIALFLLGAHGSGSRTAFAGLLVGMATYAVLWTLRRYIRSGRTRDLVGPAAVWAYPIAALLTVMSVLFVGRVRRLVLGGGEHKNSDDGRAEQWARAIKLIEKNPLGYGNNEAAERIGFKNPGRDTWTVDGYYMNILVDFGVLGFILFLLFFVGCAWAAGRAYLRAGTAEEEMGAAVAASIMAFLTAKMVLSQVENHYFAFAIAGAALAIAARQQARLRAQGGVKAPATARGAPPIPAGRPALARLGRA